MPTAKKRTKALRVAVSIYGKFMTALWLDPYEKVPQDMIVIGRASTPAGFQRVVRLYARNRAMGEGFYDRMIAASFYKPE